MQPPGAGRDDEPHGTDAPASPDELLRRARRLGQLAAEAERKRQRRERRSAAGQVGRHVADLHASLIRLAAAGRWIYTEIIAPLAAHRWAGAPWRGYRRLWRWVVYVRDADGDERLSKRRAGLMVLATAGALWLAPAFMAGFLELLWDGGRMATSYSSGHTWYLGKSQELDPEGNVFSAQGCESVTCTDQTSIYFRIKPSLAHHAWSLIHNGNVFFPDFVAAAIQNDVNKCTVTGYGSRWKLLVRNWDIYPQILAVECVPLSDDELEAVRDGRRAAPVAPPAE